MTNQKTETQEPDFASPEAGESWAKAKADFGDALNIADVKGTGKNGAIKASDVDEYVEALTAGQPDDADTGNTGDEPKAEPKPTAKDFKEIKPMKGKHIVNLTGNTFEIEGVKIEPKGKIKMTDELAASKRLANAVQVGTLGVE
jgi:hypothetical protein